MITTRKHDKPRQHTRERYRGISVLTLSTAALRLGVLLQNVDGVSPGINEVAVNTHESDEADLTEVSVSLVESQHGHVLDLADDVLLQVAEQHRSRIRVGNRRRHRLIDDVG